MVFNHVHTKIKTKTKDRDNLFMSFCLVATGELSQ